PCLFLSLLQFFFEVGWCYQSAFSCDHICTEPDTWGNVSQQCNGRSQSPINIIKSRVSTEKDLPSFQFIGQQDAFHARLLNTGHSVQLDLPSNIWVQGGNLGETYKALQLHLHWGKNGGPGSEHTIDGEQFPMEMHIVLIKEEYNSLSEAVSDREGVAVLGFFFKESRNDNKKFNPLIRALKRITSPSNTTLSGVSLEMFTLPQNNMTRYFRYDGSLTTPNCSQSVIWTLFEDTVPLSSKQLAAFSQLKFPSGKPMVNTYRPVQPLNGRQVYYSGGHVSVVSAMVLITSVLVSSLPLLHHTT
uniref:Carbonic anhydrase n=1 Tax=Sphaeramia orbicularis TaxID=375764 RepID=A0A672Y6L8_9TELE